MDVQLMKKLLSDENYYDFLKKGILSRYRSFPISENMPRELLEVTKIGNAVGVLNEIKKAYDSGLLILSDKEKNNYNFLISNVSTSIFKEDYKDKIFPMKLNSKEYNMLCSYFLDFLFLNDKEYEEFFYNNESKYNGINKKDFIYLLMSFIKKELLFRKYIFDNKTEERINEILNNEKIDVEYLYYSSENKVKYKDLDDLKLTDDLKKEILKDIPNNLDSVRKAIYIYIKLCKTLAYDSEFYALGQGLNGIDNHHGIKNIEFVTPENSEIICYEFCAIYAKLIKELGFDYEIDGDPLGMLVGTHQYLKTLLGKYFVSIDSVTSVLYGDMTRAKLNQPLEGINCLNKSKKSKNEFNLMVIEMYSLIVKQENEKKRQDNSLIFEELISNKELSIEQKIKKLVEKVNLLKFKSMDAMGYIKQLIDTNQLKQNVKFSVICDKKNVKDNKQATVSGVFTLAEEDKKFYLLYNDGLLIPISKEDLSVMFKNDELSYVDSQVSLIPGLNI